MTSKLISLRTFSPLFQAQRRVCDRIQVGSWASSFHLIEHDFGPAGKKKLTLGARRLYQRIKGTQLTLLAIKDNSD